MKKRLVSVLLSALMLFSLVACRPSAEEKTEAEQYDEWEAQVEKIRQQLKISLGGAYDVDLTVIQHSGTITASVEVESSNVKHADFGTLISNLGNRFVELAEEYSDYTFGDITFLFHATTTLGRRIGEPQIYSVGPDGHGTFLDPDSDTELFNQTPDEMSRFLSGVAPDTRSIPNPTLSQSATAPNNSFAPATAELFSEPGGEDFSDTTFYVDGVVEDVSEVDGVNTICLSTEYGDLYAYSILVSLPEVSVGDELTMYCNYTEWDKSLVGVSAVYVYHE